MPNTSPDARKCPAIALVGFALGLVKGLSYKRNNVEMGW